MMTSRVLVINCVVAVLFSSAHSLNTPDCIPVRISRRLLGDVYFLNQSNQRHGICNEGENTTYLVADRCCVSTPNLLNECSFALTLTSEPLNSTLSIPLSFITLGYSANPGAKAIVNERQGSDSLNRPINTSHCRIASLEVYRGREQAISISYRGFSFGNGSSLEINETDLVFDPMDLVGELYRMNISCLDTIESGCMFFKITGVTNITDGKFDCIVPGTLSTNTAKCPSSTTSSSGGTPLSIPVTSSTTVNTTAASGTLTNFDNVFRFDLGGLLFYVVVGVGSVMVITLILCLTGLCVALCYKKRCKHKNLRTRRKRQTGQHNYEDVFDGRTCADRTTNSDCYSSECKEAFNMMPVYTETGTLRKEKQKHSKGQEPPPECGIENPHYAKGNTRPREPAETYSALVQVGGRKSCDQLQDTEVGNNMYAVLHKS